MTTSDHTQPVGGPATDASTSRQWRVHPAAADRGLALRGGVTILLLALATVISAQSIVWGVGAILLLFIVTHRFFLPSDFTIDDTGVSARYPFRDITLPWREVRFFEHGSRAANFSRRTRRRFADRLKELHILLPTDRDERQEVLKFMKNHLPPQVVAAAPSRRTVPADPAPSRPASLASASAIPGGGRGGAS